MEAAPVETQSRIEPSFHFGAPCSSKRRHDRPRNQCTLPRCPVRGFTGCKRNWLCPSGVTDRNSVSYGTDCDRSPLSGWVHRKKTTEPSGTALLSVTCLPDSSFHSSSDFSTKNVCDLSQPDTSTRYTLVIGKRADRLIPFFENL